MSTPPRRKPNLLRYDGWSVSLLFDHGPNGRVVRKIVGPGWFPGWGAFSGIDDMHAIAIYASREKARTAVREKLPASHWQPKHGWKPRIERVSLTLRIEK